MAKLARFGRGVLLAAVVLGAIVLLVRITTPQAEAWWDDNYQYRKLVTLTTHPENYQIKIVLDKTDNLADHCLDNFQDVRFTENEEGPTLSFWIENYIAGDNAIFWVRRIDNDMRGGDNQIYIYYSNNTAESAENADNTFPFFDTFSLSKNGKR